MQQKNKTLRNRFEEITGSELALVGNSYQSSLERFAPGLYGVQGSSVRGRGERS